MQQLTILSIFTFLFMMPSSFAGSSCWNSCAQGARSTLSCARSCGVDNYGESRTCYSYCTGIRSGSRRTCTSLCQYGSSSSRDSGDTRARDEAINRGMGRNRLGDCSHRRCSQNEINDAYNQASGGSPLDQGMADNLRRSAESRSR